MVLRRDRRQYTGYRGETGVNTQGAEERPGSIHRVLKRDQRQYTWYSGETGVNTHGTKERPASIHMVLKRGHYIQSTIERLVSIIVL